MSRRLITAIAAAVTLSAAGCGSDEQATPAPATAPPTSAAVASFDLKGAFTIFINPATATLKNGDACKGSGLHGDIAELTPVKVFNGQGELLATGKLERGTFVSNAIGSACKFDMAVPAVPDGLLEYGVQVGGGGLQRVSSEDAHSWVSLTVGP